MDLRRKLTHGSDRLNGFIGTLSALASLDGEKYTWGMPETCFPAALFWELQQGTRMKALHRTMTSGGEVRAVPKPSWSWLAWT